MDTYYGKASANSRPIVGLIYVFCKVRIRAIRMAKILLSIVIPVYNEEESIPLLIADLQKISKKLPAYNFEYILVENGSADDSLKLLLYERKKDKRIKILKLSRNFGCDGGIVAGLNYAAGDAAIIMMADLQDDPNLIPKFIAKWTQGYDIVYGIVAKREGMKTTRKIGTYLFYRIMNVLSKDLLPPNVSDFRLMDRKVYEVVAAMPEHDKFFRGLSSWSGFKHTGIPFIRPKRAAGVSKANFRTVFTVARNGLFSFSDIPFQLPWIIAVVMFIAALLLLQIDVVYSIITLLFSITMVMIAVQNEYLKIILTEVRNRPNFIVDKAYGLKQ
jgi:glycosyltransferase involved in cell wall biosynthesis